MPNYKKAKYRDIRHPEHKEYLARKRRIFLRKQKRDGAQATAQSSRSAEKRQRLERYKQGMMAVIAALGGMMPKTGIHRSQ